MADQDGPKDFAGPSKGSASGRPAQNHSYATNYQAAHKNQRCDPGIIGEVHIAILKMHIPDGVYHTGASQKYSNTAQCAKDRGNKVHSVAPEILELRSRA